MNKVAMNGRGGPFTPKKNVFLLVCGLYPQIVTETLYAFYVTRKFSLEVPAEVHIITTKEGAHNARLQLLAPNTNFFFKLLEEYELSNIHFNESCIHVIHDEFNNQIDDIRTPTQNTLAANFISNMVQLFTDNPEIALHVSLAGGRKTMGYYVGYALSLFGRQHDTLSHVLVSEAFEGNRDFFFPSKSSHIIYNKSQSPLDTKDAKVELAEIPFVRLREELPDNFLASAKSFEETVRMINASNETATLIIDIKNKTIICNGFEIKLEFMAFCYYLWFAVRKKEGRMPLKYPLPFGNTEPDEHAKNTNKLYGEEVILILKKYDLWDSVILRSQSSLEMGIDKESLASKLSSLSKIFKIALNQTLAKKFLPVLTKKNKVPFIDLPIESDSIIIRY